MNKKQQTLNPEAAVEMVIKMQDRQSIEEPLKTFDFSVYRNCLEVGKISK